MHRKYRKEGHEIAINGYDHARRSDYYMRMSQGEIKDETNKAEIPVCEVSASEVFGAFRKVGSQQ